MDSKPPSSGTSQFNHEKDDLPAIAGGVPVRSREKRIVFGEPLLGEAEVAAVAECIRSRWIGLGERVGRFEQEFAAYKRSPYAAAVSSCSAGLHLVLEAMGIGPGDEVIAPTLTFCSTIHAILHIGATPVLVDCDRASMNIDPAEIERAITPRTKAVIVVHMCGRSCEMQPILEIAATHNLKVVEDCAHAIETTYHNVGAGLGRRCRMLQLLSHQEHYHRRRRHGDQPASGIDRAGEAAFVQRRGHKRMDAFCRAMLRGTKF